MITADTIVITADTILVTADGGYPGLGVAPAINPYRSQLQALLPPGDAFSAATGVVLTQLLDAMAEELARIDARAANLLDEADPRSTTELIGDWERVLGLPDSCAASDTTLDSRRGAVIAKLTASGYQTPAYYIAAAAAIGYQIAIDEFMPYESGHLLNGVEITTAQWPYVWRVLAPETTVIEFTCQSPCTEPLRNWGNAKLECLINRVKPAHTHALFAYAASGALSGRARARATVNAVLN